MIIFLIFSTGFGEIERVPIIVNPLAAKATSTGTLQLLNLYNLGSRFIVKHNGSIETQYKLYMSKKSLTDFRITNVLMMLYNKYFSVINVFVYSVIIL